jgi:uncharacterized membrane protein YbhN (UPF0104 family)
MERRLTVRVWRYVLPLILLGLAVHVILPQLATLDHSLQVIRTMALWAVALAVVAQVLSYLGSGYLLQALVAMFGQRLSLARGVLITLATSSAGLVAGGLAGATATYRWVRGSGVNAEGAVLAGWLPNLLNGAALMVVSIFGLLHLLIAHELTMLQAISFGLTLLIFTFIVGVVLWGVHHRPQLTALVMRVVSR